MMEDSTLCLHYWILRERSLGRSYVGVCKYCAAEKKFPVEVPSTFAEFRKSKKPVNVVEVQEETVFLKPKKRRVKHGNV